MDDKNTDYKEMYLKLMRETEKAVRILIEAQKACEEMYINSFDGDTSDGEE